MNIRDVQKIAFFIADEVAVFIPVTASAIAAAEALIVALEASGTIGLPPTQAEIDTMKATAKAAYDAAKASSDATSTHAKGKS